MKKRLLLLLCMIACVFSLVACDNNGSANKSSKKQVEYNQEEFKKYVEEYITSLGELTDAQAEAELEVLDEGTFAYNLVKIWVDNKEDLGTLESIKKYNFTADDKAVTCKVDTVYSKHTATYTFVVYADGVTENTVGIVVDYTMKEKMTKACLNTVLGMGTVFIVLMFIAVLIWAFKFINKAEQAIKNKKTAADTAVAAVDNTIAQIVEKEEEYVDDLELIAVITAAIAASEGNNVSPDDLVVRSIKRVNKSKWLRA